MTVFAAPIFLVRVNKDKLNEVQRLDKSSVECRRGASEGKAVTRHVVLGDCGDQTEMKDA